jgi:hypothetical protein
MQGEIKIYKKTFFVTIIFLLCFLQIPSNGYSAEKKRRKGLFRKVKSAEENISANSKASIDGVRGISRRACKISEVQIPEDLGLVKDSYKGAGDKLVVHIQDAHCNYEAQTNIYKMIELLVEKNKLKLLAVEGSEGVIDTGTFSSFPDQKIKKEVADYFMKKGRITGPEYLCIIGENKLDLFGIEKKETYMDNLNAFKKTMPYRPKFEKAVEAFKNVIDQLKPKIFNRELLEMDSKLNEYESQDLGFSKYCEYLIEKAKSKTIDIVPYKNMTNFAIVSSLENAIDFKKVDKERNDLVESIKNKLSRRYMSELVVRTTNYKNGKITAGEYHNYIVNLAKGKQIPTEKYENLDLYAKYMIAFENIDHDELLKEKERIEVEIKDKVYENSEQKTLDDFNKIIKTIDKFYQLEMARDDLEYYNIKKNLFSFQKFIAFTAKYAPKYNIDYNIPPGVIELDSYFKDFVAYYGFAVERDDILISNTLKRMKEDNTNIAVMVCGGFHTQGMMRILKKKNISYVVLAPRITKEDPNNPYLKILLGQDNPFEDLFEEEEGEEGAALEETAEPVVFD